MKSISSLRQVLALTAIAVLSSAVLAQTTSMPIKPMASMPGGALSTLSSAAEVPPNTSGGTGTVETAFNKQTNELSWIVTYQGLSGPLTAAHFHGPAMPGANAGVVVPVAAGITASPIKGSATLTPAQAADLSAGKWYLNLHTAANPGGEVRAQIAPQP